jgi:hypothetical protein
VLWLFVFCGLLLAALVLVLQLRMRGGPGTVIPWIGFAGKLPADANELHWLTAKMGPAKVDLEDKEAVRQALDDR